MFLLHVGGFIKLRSILIVLISTPFAFADRATLRRSWYKKV